MPQALPHPHTFSWPQLRLPMKGATRLADHVSGSFLCALMAVLEWPVLLRSERLFGRKGFSLTQELEEAEREY